MLADSKFNHFISYTSKLRQKSENIDHKHNCFSRVSIVMIKNRTKGNLGRKELISSSTPRQQSITGGSQGRNVRQRLLQSAAY